LINPKSIEKLMLRLRPPRFSKHCRRRSSQRKGMFIQKATAAWRCSRRNGLNKTN